MRNDLQTGDVVNHWPITKRTWSKRQAECSHGNYVNKHLDGDVGIHLEKDQSVCYQYFSRSDNKSNFSSVKIRKKKKKLE